MNNVASQLQQSAQTIDGDGVTSQNIRATAVNVKDITERVEKIAASMEKITNDPASQADLKTTLHNTAQISTKVNNILGNGKITVQGEAGMLYNDTKGESGANVNFKVYRDKSFALIGAESIGNGTALNLQYGYHAVSGSIKNVPFDNMNGVLNGDGQHIDIPRIQWQYKDGYQKAMGTIDLDTREIELSLDTYHMRLERLLSLAEVDMPLTGWVQNHGLTGRSPLQR